MKFILVWWMMIKTMMNTLNFKTEFCCFEFFSLLTILSNSNSSVLLIEKSCSFYSWSQGTRSDHTSSSPWHEFTRVQASSLYNFKMKENWLKQIRLRRQSIGNLINLFKLEEDYGMVREQLELLNKTNSINELHVSSKLKSSSFPLPRITHDFHFSSITHSFSMSILSFCIDIFSIPHPFINFEIGNFLSQFLVSFSHCRIASLISSFQIFQKNHPKTFHIYTKGPFHFLLLK